MSRIPGAAAPSRRPLPAEDPALDELAPAEKGAVAETWFRRAASELDVGAEFELLVTAFSEGGSSPEVQASLVRAVEEERRHSEICAAVGARYAGSPRLFAPVPAKSLVRFGSTSERVSRLLHLVLLSSVNEVTSTFYLRDCMKGTRSPLARAALRELLADDVRHARIGWTHLASSEIQGEDRVHVSAAMPTLLRLSHEAWTTVPARAEPWFAAHGCPGLEASRGAFENAVRDVILPGLAFVGIDPTPAARWTREVLRLAIRSP